jgi:hypothetical protein
VGIPSCGDDAVNRAMIRVVVTVILVSGVRVERVAYFTAFLHIFHTVRVWAEVIFCRYITALSSSTY